MKYLVIKCGGSVIEELPQSFYKDLCELQSVGNFRSIVVHGGGKLITSMLDKLDIPSVFMDGLRVTTEEMLDVIEMALSGNMNKKITRRILALGGSAVGISGIDGLLLEAESVNTSLGFTGKVKAVNINVLQRLCEMEYIPVVSPVGVDTSGQRYNINADVAASAIATALRCPLLLISDIPGILAEAEGIKQPIPALPTDELDALINIGAITGGMIPKVTAAKEAILNGVKEVVIMNGHQENVLIRYLNQEQIGTKLYKKEVMNHV